SQPHGQSHTHGFFAKWCLATCSFQKPKQYLSLLDQSECQVLPAHLYPLSTAARRECHWASTTREENQMPSIPCRTAICQGCPSIHCPQLAGQQTNPENGPRTGTIQ